MNVKVIALMLLATQTTTTAYAQTATTDSPVSGSRTPLKDSPVRDSRVKDSAATDTLESTSAPELQETVHIIGKRQGNYTIITEDTLKLTEMPGALGDPLGAISALPGVITPAGGGEPAVRGSSPADNRYFVDGMPAGYIFHEFNTSIFDENVVQDFQLYSAGFGAEFSNATGAVFDIRLRDPANQPLTTTVSASLLRAGILVESGLTENSAFYLSARNGLIRLFYPEDDEPDEDGIRIQSAPEDTDYVFKALWEPGDQRLTLSMVGASDHAAAELTDTSEFAFENPDFAGDAEIDNAFNSQSIQWESALTDSLKARAIFAHYKYRYGLFWGEGYYNNTVLDDISFRGALEYSTGDHTLVTGTEISQADFDYNLNQPHFVCTELDANCSNNRLPDILTLNNTVELNQTTVYALDRWQMSERFSVEAGVQWTESDYNHNQFTHPRLAINWQWHPSIALKASAGTYNRFPEAELVMESVGNPNLDSQKATHTVVGFEGSFKKDWTWSVEAYHKAFEDLPLALGPSQPDSERFYANDVEGSATGLDLFLNKNLSNKWYGWVSLSLSESTRENLRNGASMDYVFDVPWVLNAVGNYQWTEKWNVGFRLTAKAGEPYTPMIGLRIHPNFPDQDPPVYQPVYDTPYSDRLPTYARLDVRFKRDIEWFGQGGSFFIDIINATNRENVVEIAPDYKHISQTGTLKTEKEADLGLFPSVGVSFSF